MYIIVGWKYLLRLGGVPSSCILQVIYELQDVQTNVEIVMVIRFWIRSELCSSHESVVIIFDGICHLCASFVCTRLCI